MKEYKFAESLSLAIRCANDLRYQNQSFIQGFYRLSEKPSKVAWEMAGFFTRIIPTEIVVDGFKLSRSVDFHYKDKKVATVELKGIGSQKKKLESWTISKISYFSNVEGHLSELVHMGDKDEPDMDAWGWVEYPCELGHLSEYFPAEEAATV